MVKLDDMHPDDRALVEKHLARVERLADRLVLRRRARGRTCGECSWRSTGLPEVPEKPCLHPDNSWPWDTKSVAADAPACVEGFEPRCEND